MPSPPLAHSELAGLNPAKRALLDARLRGLRLPSAGLVPRARGAEAPLSFAQERLWFLHRLQPGSASYNLPAALRLSGELRPEALEAALGAVVRRHEVLRATFREVDGVPVQAVAPFGGFALPREDLSILAPAEREAEARRRAAGDAALPFDLQAGPPFRARLLRLADDEHVLLLCMHHIVSDGWSVRVLFRELWALYGAAREGREAPLAPPPVQYADYALWQREQAGGDAERRQLAWWKAHLAGAPEVMEIPADHPRPPVPSGRGAHVAVDVGPEVARRLRALARAGGATLYMAVLAGFQALLSRYTGSGDVMVGTLAAGRTRPEVQALIGLFAQTLVLRTDLSGDPSFRQALGRARETVLGAFDHQDVPFERLVGELRPERSLSHATLFQVLFQLDEADEADESGDDADPGAGAAAGTPRMREMGSGGGTTKFDLTLVLRSGEEGITGVLEYSVDLFEPGTARRMAGHLRRVLEQAAADPDRRLSRLELADEAERARVAGWNRTQAPYPADRCVHQLFEAQARRSPDAVAVTFAGGSLTFAELDARANRLARYLARLGVGPEDRVGLCMERGPELLPAVLGVMKAGGAWVPMDPAHPAERLAYLMEDSGVRVLLTQDRVRGRLPAPRGVRVVGVDGEGERIGREGADAPETGVGAGNLAYVIYTSGSTGRPKGVAMHHRGVCNYIDWGIRAYGADAGNGAPVFSSMAVDLTLTNLLPLFAGRPVHLLAEDSPVEALAHALRRRPGYGLIKITPVHLGLLNAMLEPGELSSAARTLVVGADFLSAEPTVAWQEHAPEVRLMNEYGPTETVVGCSAYPLAPGVHRSGPVPVGGPIQNLRFHVLDAALRPVPVGLPGELFIGGAGVARGYLGRPALTAEKFVPEPSAGPGARMYRTGDRARWLDGGSLLVLGRTDHQVKIRGYRVEPGEVEAALRRHPEVRDCRVLPREDPPGERRLVAYVVGGAGAEELREHLRRSLPEPMVPGAFVTLESLPQTPTGKLDPSALPPPPPPAAAELDDEPRSYLEAQLVLLWEELLATRGIGPTQNFFELGGNSFLALRLFARANRALGCDLPVATLFAGATVRRMARAVEEQRRAPDPAASVVALQPNGTLPPLFVIHSSDRDVMGYVSLVRHLGAEQPVFGVRDVGGDLSRPLARIAAEHVAAIRAACPDGPYYLAGWSFGGFVAYEMALQLERMGQAVAFVGLLDTLSPVLAAAWPWNRDQDLALTLAAEVAAQMRRPFSFPAEELEGLDRDAQLRRVAGALHAQGAAPPEFDAAALAAQCQVIRDRNRSYAGYQPGRFSGTLTLFRATGPAPGLEEFLAPLDDAEKHTLGWSRHAGGPVEVHPVPGSHATLGSEPHVRVLAERMRRSLAAARERSGPAPAAPEDPSPQDARTLEVPA